MGMHDTASEHLERVLPTPISWKLFRRAWFCMLVCLNPITNLRPLGFQDDCMLCGHELENDMLSFNLSGSKRCCIS